jgi:tight adherence protein C
MLAVLIAVGVTLFLCIALVLMLFQRRSAAEARLAGAVHGFQETATVNHRQLILADVSSAAERLRRTVGVHNTTAAGKQLALAGYRKPEHIEIFYAVRLLLPATLAILVSIFVKSNPFFWFVAAIAAGYYLPEMYVSRCIRKRREAIRLGLPDALDLLAICLEAGLGLDQALMRVGVELGDNHPELSDEFEIIGLEQRAGTPRLEAWRHMSDRTGLEIVSAFVSMLVQTDKFGTPISRAMAVFSDTLRTQRRQAAEEAAAKTTVKMVFPLVFFIFPSMFIVLLAPAVISVAHNLSKAFG